MIFAACFMRSAVVNTRVPHTRLHSLVRKKNHLNFCCVGCAAAYTRAHARHCENYGPTRPEEGSPTAAAVCVRADPDQKWRFLRYISFGLHARLFLGDRDSDRRQTMRATACVIISTHDCKKKRPKRSGSLFQTDGRTDGHVVLVEEK